MIENGEPRKDNLVSLMVQKWTSNLDEKRLVPAKRAVWQEKVNRVG